MANATFNRSVLPSICIVIWIYLDYFHRGSGGRKGLGFVLLSMTFNQHGGARYLRSKSYLVVKISSDVLTKHWCQVCILSMMSLLLWLPAGMVCYCAIRKQEYHVVWTSLLQANMGIDMNKYSLHLIFPFYLNRDTSVLELFPVVVLKNKSQWALRWPIYWQSKPSLKLSDRSSKIQNDVHIDTYHCKPKISAW